MKARLAIVVLAAPLWGWAADSSAPRAAAPVLTTAQPAERLQPAVVQSKPQVRQDLTAASWPATVALQGRSARAESAATEPAAGRPSDTLPNSGLQLYALVAAGIAAVGFMASRRTRS